MSDPDNYSFGKDAIRDKDAVTILDAVESEYLGTKLDLCPVLTQPTPCLVK